MKYLLLSVLFIALFTISNSISAQTERRSLPGHQNINVIEQTTSDNPSRLGNSTTVVSDPIETSKKIDKPKDDSKKPKRHIFNKVVTILGGAFFIFAAIYLKGFQGPM